MIQRNRKIWLFLLGLSIGLALSWTLFVLLYSPTDAQFLRTAYAQYFKELSAADLNQYGSYGDCRLIDQDQHDKRMGLKKTAICALNMPDGQIRALVIAMTQPPISYTPIRKHSLTTAVRPDAYSHGLIVRHCLAWLDPRAWIERQ